MSISAFYSRLLAIGSCLASLLLPVQLLAQPSPHIGLITGAKTGTYIQIGEDISKLVNEEGIEFSVHESNGSLENIAAVFERDDIQLGLVQSDVLGYLQESQNRKLERVAQKIAMMFPLYNEEVHLIAKKEISQFQDLNHRVVAVGSMGSGTNLTSELLFEVSNIWPQKKYLLKDEEALQWLEEGKIDALFNVSGYPVKLLENIDREKFHLVPIKNENLGGYYLDSTIPSGVYDWQQGDVQAYLQGSGIPVNPLYSRGFASIGCQPCTRAVNPDEPERAGRWWWESSSGNGECGLHVRPQAAPEKAL